MLTNILLIAQGIGSLKIQPKGDEYNAYFSNLQTTKQYGTRINQVCINYPHTKHKNIFKITSEEILSEITHPYWTR